MAKFWSFGGNSNICLLLGLWDLKHLFAQFGHFFKLLAIKEFETDPVRIMWSISKIDVNVDGNVVADVFFWSWSIGEGDVEYVEKAPTEGDVLDEVGLDQRTFT